MESPELVEIALRVLSAWSQGQEPDPQDVEVLRKYSPADLAAQVAVDELACFIVGQETSRVMSASRADRKGMKTDTSTAEEKIA